MDVNCQTVKMAQMHAFEGHFVLPFFMEGGGVWRGGTVVVGVGVLVDDEFHQPLPGGG